MQTKQKWALTLMMALGAVSCGGSTQPGDAYQGFIDATQLDSKFLPGTCGSSKCYQPMTGSANGAAVGFYNLGFLDKSDKSLGKDSAGRPVMAATTVKGLSYDFEGCKTGKEFDARTDAYREDVQYSVFDTLPLTGNPAPILPLLHVKQWTGVSQYTCNAIKDATSLTGGDFGGAAADGDSVALRAAIDMTVTFKPLSTTSTFQPTSGWYRGLQFTYLDGGTVPVDADGNLTVMDGVLVKPSSGTAPKVTDPTAVVVFQASPGNAQWSPVVRVREFTVPGGAKPTDYKSLCYDPGTSGCPAGSIDMTKTTVGAPTGLLFVVGSTL